MYRKARGCDGPADEPTDRLPCFECGGLDADCKACGGFGEVLTYDCPNRLRDPWYSRILQHLLIARDGHLPVEGGALDQAASFMAALNIALGEIGRIEEGKVKSARE